MIALDDTFDGTFPFAPHVFDRHGVRQHYIDEGDGPPMLLLHGEPSWGYLYREIVPVLARHHRVIVPDLVGFGKSETPPGFDYSAKGQADALEALLLGLDLTGLTLVLHDWGGPIGGAVALRHPGRVRRLALLNTVLPLGLPSEPVRLQANAAEARYFRWMRRLHEEGRMEAVLGELGILVPAVMKGLQGVERPIDETWMRAYGAAFARPEECLGAIELPRLIVSGRNRPEPAAPEAVAALRAKPAMIIYGLRDRVLLPHHFIPLFEEAFPGAPVHELSAAGHFLQEDAPETIALLIRQFALGL